MLNAIMTPPAARRKKSRAPQRVISTMDTMVGLLDLVNLSKVERRYAGGCQPLGVPCMAVPRRLTRKSEWIKRGEGRVQKSQSGLLREQDMSSW